jgi:hypothetical protein
MADPIKRALTRRRVHRGRLISEEPNQSTVYVVKFALGMAVCLVVLQVAHLAVLHSWNSEVFAAIAGLCGTVMGVFVGQKT